MKKPPTYAETILGINTVELDKIIIKLLREHV